MTDACLYQPLSPAVMPGYKQAFAQALQSTGIISKIHDRCRSTTGLVMYAVPVAQHLTRMPATRYGHNVPDNVAIGLPHRVTCRRALRHAQYVQKSICSRAHADTQVQVAGRLDADAGVLVRDVCGNAAAARVPACQ
jgi:hypothetical protein